MFGEVRSATVRAVTYTEIFMITRFDLDTVLQSFPVIARQFKSFSKDVRLYNEIKKAADEAKQFTAPGNAAVMSQNGCGLTTALALMLNPGQAAVIHTELSATVVANISDTFEREMVTGPYSTQLALDKTFVRRHRISEVRRKSRDVHAVKNVEIEMSRRAQRPSPCDLLSQERPPRQPSKSFSVSSLKLKWSGITNSRYWTWSYCFTL